MPFILILGVVFLASASTADVVSAAEGSPSIEQLLTSGGALGVLVAIVLAFYSGRVLTKTSSDERVKTVSDMWTERFADERAEKEAWKSQAQQLTPAVAKMADELEEANQRDEAWKAAFTRGEVDRRQG